MCLCGLTFHLPASHVQPVPHAWLLCEDALLHPSLETPTPLHDQRVVWQVVVGKKLDDVFMVMEFMEHDLKGLMEERDSSNPLFAMSEVCLHGLLIPLSLPSFLPSSLPFSLPPFLSLFPSLFPPFLPPSLLPSLPPSLPSSLLVLISFVLPYLFLSS